MIVPRERKVDRLRQCVPETEMKQAGPEVLAVIQEKANFRIRAKDEGNVHFPDG
jgi:hypothetical protein